MIVIIHPDPRDGVALAAFKSERWPASRRNSGRLQIGIPGRLRRNIQASMNPVSTVGLDLAKYIFQLHGADSAGAVVFRKKLRRGQLLAFLATLPRCTVAMEACGSAHYWGREITKLGHTVRLIAPAYVK